MIVGRPLLGGDWPLVGRAGELRLLTDLLDRPDAKGLVLAGPAGVGKTRLGLEWMRAAERAGFAVARTTAIRGALEVPFAAVAPLLGAPTPGEIPLGGADSFRRFASAIANRAGGARLALLIDDAHLLDDLSAMLIYQLAASDASVVLLLTVRSREAAPDPVTALWKDGILGRLELGGLDGESVEQLLVAALGDPVDRAAVARLAARCQGNVFFLRELVLGALEAGTLVLDGGVWRLAGSLIPSPRLVEIIQSRLADLSESELALLDGLSLAEPLGPAELAALASYPDAEHLERAGLIRSGLAGHRLEFRLAHPLHAEVLRSRQSALRVRRLTSTLAQAVEATGARRQEDGLRLATWYLDARDAPLALLVAATETARRHNNLPLAERLARAAMAAGGGLPMAVTAAELALLQGRGDEAEAALADLASKAVGEAELALVATSRIENLRLFGRYAESLVVADEAMAELGGGDGCDELAAKKAWVLAHVAGPRAAAESAELVRTRAQSRGLVWSSLVSSWALARGGRFHAGLGAAQQGRSAYLALGEARREWLSAAHRLAEADVLMSGGRLAEAEAIMSAEYELAVSHGLLDSQAGSVWQLARVYLAQGRPASAARCAREACALLRHLHRPALLRDALVPLAMAEALAGRGDRAAETLAEAGNLGLPPSYWAEVERLATRAWIEVASGDLAKARGLLGQAVTVGQEIGDVVGVGAVLHDLSRLGGADEAAPALAALVETVEGDLAPAQAGHAAALSKGDAAGLDAASLCFEALGYGLLAAEASADAALHWKLAGEARAAAASGRRGGMLAARCEDATTPALRSMESRLLLTPAERECAQLAVLGRSNRDIAGTLYLSIRTVENRLQRIYEKLGVSGRVELAQALEG